MTISLNGETRLFAVAGDPIAQVKAPANLTRIFSERGLNAIFIPFHVKPEGLKDFFAGARRVLNLDGMTITVPHKIAAAEYVADLTDRARFLGAVNVVRRQGEGWTGDMVDGLGFVGAIERHGYDPRGKKALMVGAGGVGSAISFSLLDAGIARLAIHDIETGRRDRLIERLRARKLCDVAAGTPDPAGFDLVINASPLGMAPDDPLPMDVGALHSGIFVADVVPTPLMTRFLIEASQRGCRIQTGGDMFNAQVELILNFLLGHDRP